MTKTAAAVIVAMLVGCTTSIEPSSRAGDSSPVPTSAPPAMQPTASASESPRTGRLVAGDWVGVVVDGMQIRRIAGQDGDILGVVTRGGVGVVIGDPEDVDGQAWLPVAAPGLPYDAGCVGTGPPGVFDVSCPLWRGWLPAAGPDGEPSVVQVELDCPDDPSDANELLAVPLGVSVACFGGETLSVQANVSPDMAGRGCPPDHGAIPPWMHPCAELFFPSRTGDGLQGLLGMLHPSVATCEEWSDDTCLIAPLIGESVEVHGSFDHPEAELCDETTPGVDMQMPDPVFIEYFCRTRFVITGLEPAD